MTPSNAEKAKRRQRKTARRAARKASQAKAAARLAEKRRVESVIQMQRMRKAEGR